MTAKNRTLSMRITEKQHEALEALVERSEHASTEEFIQELLRDKVDEFIRFLHERAEKDREHHVPLEEYGRSRGLE